MATLHAALIYNRNYQPQHKEINVNSIVHWFPDVLRTYEHYVQPCRITHSGVVLLETAASPSGFALPQHLVERYLALPAL